MASSEYGIEGRGRDTDLHPAGSAQTSTLRAPPRMQQRHRAGSSPEEKKKKGQQLTTLQEQAQAVESRIRELASSNATVSATARGPLSAIAAALPLVLAVATESHHSAAVVLAVEVAQQQQLLKWH